jgi:hypothetical protein
LTLKRQAILLLLGALQRRWGKQASKSADRSHRRRSIPGASNTQAGEAAVPGGDDRAGVKMAAANQNAIDEQVLPVSVSLRPYREREAETVKVSA